MRLPKLRLRVSEKKLLDRIVKTAVRAMLKEIQKHIETEYRQEKPPVV